jgi:FtsZ-binding cell division protein ZapB
MPIEKSSHRAIDGLLLEIQEHKREKNSILQENSVLRNQNAMLLDTLEALTADNTYWSEEAIKTGIVFRLKNVLNNIKNNR